MTFQYEVWSALKGRKRKRPVFPIEKISNVKLFLLNGLVIKKRGGGETVGQSTCCARMKFSKRTFQYCYIFQDNSFDVCRKMLSDFAGPDVSEYLRLQFSPCITWLWLKWPYLSITFGGTGSFPGHFM